MKLIAVLAAFLVSATASAAAVHADATITAAPTEMNLEKRWKNVVINKDYKKLQELKAGSTSEAPVLRAWMRTIYSTKVEIVTPTVIAGVTFSASPPATTNGLEPWVSLKKDGSPVTVQPKMKNGRIEKSSPDYSTYFQTATTVLYNKEQLKAHNMEDDQIFEQVEFIPEDLNYQLLNPIMRCTPQFYKMSGFAKDRSLEPFCFPHDNTKLYMDKTYFITWYTRFFLDDVKSVRLHLSYIKESLHQQGLKRDLDEVTKEKRSVVIEGGGKIGESSFFVSDPIERNTGIFPITILPEWFAENTFYHKVLISLQPDNVPDEEFDHMANFIIIEINQKARVAKGHHEDLKKLSEKLVKQASGDYEVIEGIDYEKYLVIISIPSCVVLATFGMWLFVRINKRNTDVSFLRNVKLNRRKAKSKPYSRAGELPRWDGPSQAKRD